MRPLTQREIRASFVNCTKGEATRMHVPHDLDTRPWGELDYFGWRDPQSPGRGYLVADLDGRLQGITLRAPQSTVGSARKSMCSLCMTMRSGGVSLMVAPRAGSRGQHGNTVGTYICADLQCSLSIRGKRPVDGPGIPETLSAEDRAIRLLNHLGEFLGRVNAPN